MSAQRARWLQVIGITVRLPGSDRFKVRTRPGGAVEQVKSFKLSQKLTAAPSGSESSRHRSALPPTESPTSRPAAAVFEMPTAPMASVSIRVRRRLAGPGE